METKELKRAMRFVNGLRKEVVELSYENLAREVRRIRGFSFATPEQKMRLFVFSQEIELRTNIILTGLVD